MGEVLGGGVGQETLGVFYLTHLWAVRAWRKEGLGARLLAATEEAAGRLNCSEVRLDTLNRRAVPFYTRNGYEVYAVLQDYIPGFDRHFLRKVRERTTRARSASS